MKKIFRYTLPILALLVSSSCLSKNKGETTSSSNDAQTEEQTAHTKLSPQDLQQYETAYFASGCFWCVEAIYESVRGVAEVISGYSGGEEENPTYEQVSYGKTPMLRR